MGPPTSLLSPEQKKAARLDPLKFRHAVGRGVHASQEEAQEWLRSARQQGAVVPAGPTVFVYRIAKGDLVATGIVAEVSITAYDSGLVKRHESTIAKTERKMAKYMHRSRILGNPVALTHRPHAAVSEAIAAQTMREPDCSFIDSAGYSHALWGLERDDAFDLCRSFRDPLYITDGHHRLAAASRVAAEEGRVDPHLPAGIFSSDELRLRSFARCVVDPDVDTDAVISRLSSEHSLEEVSDVEARPLGRFDFGVRIAGRSFRLHIDRDRVPDDLYGSLDVNLLQDLILEPIFGIDNPRQDPRLHFVADLADESDESRDWTAWFLPFPTTVSDVMAVADMGLAMPPKSTWFAPKVPSGLVCRMLDRT